MHLRTECGTPTNRRLVRTNGALAPRGMRGARASSVRTRGWPTTLTAINNGSFSVLIVRFRESTLLCGKYYYFKRFYHGSQARYRQRYRYSYRKLGICDLAVADYIRDHFPHSQLEHDTSTGNQTYDIRLMRHEELSRFHDRYVRSRGGRWRFSTSETQ